MTKEKVAAAKDMEKEPSESKSYKSAIAKQLEFPGTPHSMDLDSPMSLSMSESSPLSSVATSLTPPPSVASGSRGHGHPRKPIAKPDYSDFPFEGSSNDQIKWFKAKNTDVWWYNKLISEEEEEYHSKEREHVLKYYYEKKKAATEAAENLDDIQYLDVDEKKKDRAKELSKIR